MSSSQSQEMGQEDEQSVLADIFGRIAMDEEEREKGKLYTRTVKVYFKQPFQGWDEVRPRVLEDRKCLVNTIQRYKRLVGFKPTDELCDCKVCDATIKRLIAGKTIEKIREVMEQPPATRRVSRKYGEMMRDAAEYLCMMKIECDVFNSRNNTLLRDSILMDADKQLYRAFGGPCSSCVWMDRAGMPALISKAGECQLGPKAELSNEEESWKKYQNGAMEE